MNYNKILFTLVLFSGSCLSWAAETHPSNLRMPTIFSDHMVLQAGAQAPVWGWAKPGDDVVVTVAGQSQKTTVSADGTWRVSLKNLQVQKESQVMTVSSGNNTVTVQDVLIGEVWLASGQSNMGITVNRMDNFEQLKAKAGKPLLRIFKTKDVSEKTPQADCEGAWKVSSAGSVAQFSAVSFIFGNKLQEVLQSPVGIINASVGGSCIEAWIDTDTQRAIPALAPTFEWRQKQLDAYDAKAEEKRHQAALAKWEKEAASAKAAGKTPPRKPGSKLPGLIRATNVGGFFNALINPLIPYSISGVIWYQGESNAVPHLAPYYETQLHLLVNDWRARWGKELPFAWVQLPNLVRVESWVHIREAQLKSLDMPRTGMVVSIDLGQSRNLHPLNKDGIGHRLANWALGTVYGRNVPTSGPLYKGCKRRGSEIVLEFDHTDGGLRAKNEKLDGFVIAGDDRNWKAANAYIKENAVIVSSKDVSKPAAVRYAWADDPPCTLYNGAGLPASPFRTDEWPLAEKQTPRK